MQQVAPDVHRLGSRVHNFFVITAGGKATVIDAGCSKEWPALVKGLNSIGMGPDDVEAIILTHAHADHIGFAAEASEAGTRVKAHELEAPIARGDTEGYSVQPYQLPLWKPATWSFLFALIKVGVMKAPRVENVETFGDDEVLDLPGHPKAIHTPGHTVGHAAFYLEEPRLLFSGDALVTMDLTGKGRGPQLLGSKFHLDEAQARASLSRMEGLDTSIVLPGHGDPWHGQVADAIAAMRAT